MRTTLWLYGIAFVVFLILDMLWLALIAKGFYQAQLGHLMTPSVNWAAALVFYVLYIAGVVFFVIEPAFVKQDWMQALGYGAFFGLLCYATYDLSNLATLKQWPLLVTVVDLVWGTSVTAAVATITYFIANSLKIM
ncbi:MAG: DUF2177 family protein [Erysipelotrichaceae bacterium]